MSKTGDALLKLAQQNPDVTIRGEMPISGRSGWLNSTGGSDLVSQSMQTPESPLEAQFLQLWVMLGGPELEREERFNDDRMWRSDFLHAPTNTLIEIEGLTWQPNNFGRHQRPKGYSEDCRKYNDATMRGYRVIRLTTLTMEPDYIESIIKWMEGTE